MVPPDVGLHMMEKDVQQFLLLISSAVTALTREIMKARRSHKRALIAVAHKMLVAVYVLSKDTPYQELGAEYLDRLEPERLKLNLVQRLERLGYQVKSYPKRN